MIVMPRSRLAFERPETAARLRRALAQMGLGFETELDLRTGPPNAGGCDMLLIEQVIGIEAAVPRIYSLAGAHPELMIVVCVRAPRTEIDRELLRAGAFDVVDDGPDLESNLAHTVAAARRVMAVQDERRRLSATLAHQDKIAALGVLAAGVSHEINNPCAAILSNLNSLREQLEAVVARPRFQRLGSVEDLLPDALEALSDCIGAANRIHSIVKTLNVFSRKADNDVSISLDVNEQVKTVLRLIGKEVKYRAAFETKLAPNLPRIKGPPNSITQVVTNLVVNALHALEDVPAAERRVWVSTDFDDEHVMLEVGDNGPGMTPDVLSRIFDPFFTTKAVGKGTGLGLSITRQLVREMGGEVFVDSAPGEGARFSVFFERSQVGSSAEMRAAVPPASDRRRVMLVDDDPLLLRGMERALRNHFDVVAARSGREALAFLAQDQEIDVLLIDVVMPDMTGVQLFAAIEAAHPVLVRRTVFVTGGVAAEDLRAGLERTGRPCLLKPVDTPELVKTVRAIVREETGTSSGTHPLALLKLS